MLKNRVFLDTNIVADIIDKSRVNHEESLKLLKKLIINDYDICISEDMISTLFYISKDKKSTLDFFVNVVFIDWKVLFFGQNVVQIAVKFALEKELDLEDLLQCLCAKENECAVIITNDKKFCDCGIKIMTTKEFINN